ncbi:MAG: 30S ribosomal protein S11 [Thermodesulfobacteriota bacterium]|jgi:small subunit ribosomal protein S11|nr:30S ribosomal protein S11 [Candidatus Dadabacteria bacterium]MCH7948883.1 30S ribosomal protein S11 [Candidatus Dadabacteria bacterium]MCZ6469546.1 30S ribosomal protein S11 [Candidatus Dadabacteria bacterium]MCZ6554586.1 30S ribosomal protein S11 [Candidatus Dadabacteria bacterium]MCZ6639863.1 30S ribosomal protein S11 [Candidatus Dadabacteria bacterium]
MATKKSGKKKAKKFVEQGVINIKATFNNTLITISDTSGNVVAWSSGGMKGFKGTRKGTPFAAQIAAEDAAKKAAAVGMKSVSVYVKGPGPGREPAIRSIQASGLKITFIRDVTPIPHNGCRPPGRRRV